MKSVKNHFSVIFSLFVMLFSLEFILLLNKTVNNYEVSMNEDYSIVIVSSKSLNEDELQANISNYKSIHQLSAKQILDKLKNDISEKNISLLQNSLPNFYSLKLKKFPSTKEIKTLKAKLLKIEGIKKLETFSKTYDKIYKVLVISKTMSYVFSFLLFMVSILLMSKQMRIWVLEHKERMDIMALFGAAFWMKSIVLYRLAIIDSFIASFLVIISFTSALELEYFNNLTQELGIKLAEVNIFLDTSLLVLIALIFSLFSVSLAMRKMHKGS